MPYEENGFIWREKRNDLPTHCQCCSPARRLLKFRSSPKTELLVCPATRASIIAYDDARMPLSGGFYTGSLDGV